MKSKLLVALAILAAGCGATSAPPTSPAPTTTSLQIVADQKTFDVGSDQRLRAVAVMSDGSTSALTTGLTWSTSNNSILDIISDGTVTAVSSNEADVTVSWNGLTASLRLRGQQTRSGVFVRGRITELSTGASVASQKIWIGDTTATTDVSGNYSVWLPKAGETFLGFAAPFFPGSNFFASPGFRGDLLLSSTGCSGRYGRVVDFDTGAPLAGVAIREVWAGGKTVPSTAADGTYRFDICPGIEIGNSAWVEFSLSGYRTIPSGVGRGRMDVYRADIRLPRAEQR